MVRASQERVGSYFYFLPTYKQGKKVIWEAIDRDGFKVLNHFPKELRDGPINNTEMKITGKNGSIIRIVGSDNIDSIVGTNPVGVVFSEYSISDPRSWDYIRPILRENGGWAMFNGTPRGKQNHLYKMYQMALNNEDFFVQKLSIEDTGVLTEADIEAERASGMDEELIQQEYYCSFEVGAAGSFYGTLMAEVESQGRILDVPYNPQLPVDTWWDIGMHDSTAVVFVQSEPGSDIVRVIDYYEDTGQGLDHYARHLRDLPYIYRDHIGPHDLMVRDFGSGKSRLEMARNYGINFKVARRLSFEDGVNAVRTMLPMCVFDGTKCERLLDALYSYHKKWDRAQGAWGDKAEHDWSSHGADAFRYGAVGRRNARIDHVYRPYDRKNRRRSRGSWMAA